MKQNLLKTMLFSAALVAGSYGGVMADNGNGIINTLPVTEDFENGTGIFTGGQSGDFGGQIGNVLNVYGGATAVSTFDVDAETEGSQAYELKNNEKVTIAYTAYQGYFSGTYDVNVSVNNSAGVPLVKYTYRTGNCQIVDVAIGGKTVSGFSAFACQSKAKSKGANGFSNSKSQGFLNIADNNPQITISISKNGLVSISFVCKANSVDKTFTASLGDDILKDLANITISSPSKTIEDRGYVIDNLSINSEISTAATATYTIKKVCGSLDLGSESGTGEVGSTPTLAGENIWIDGKKYIYVSNDAEEVGTITSAGTVYTLTYREAASYNYSVVGKVGNETLQSIATGTNYEGETVKVPYRRYVQKDGVWYEAARGTVGYYLASAELTKDNQEINVKYSVKDLPNVTYFKEAEEIEGLTVSTNQNADVRCSNGAGAYNSAEEPVNVVTLPAGKYKLTIGLWGGRSNQNFKLNCGDEWVVPFTGSFQDVSKEITLNEATTIAIPKSDAANGRCLDYVLVQQLADLVKVSDLTYATYVPACNVVAPENVKVYTVKANEAKSSVTLNELAAGTVIPAGTAVLVGAPAETYTFTASADAAPAITENDLQAATADTKGDGATTYALTSKGGKPVFGLVAEGVTIPEGKAYLQLSAPSAAKYFAIGTGVVTGINEVNAAANDADDAYYTLQGMKTNKAAKGIYIHNGKKVVIK